MRSYIALLLVLCVCGWAVQAPAGVVITLDQTVAEAFNGAAFNADVKQNTGGATAVATLPGYSSATTTVFNPASISAGYVQSRSGNQAGYSFGHAYARFTTDVDVPYTAVGTFLNSAGYTGLYSYLYDFTLSSYLFYSDQQSMGGPVAFTLGGLAGNYSNAFIGSLTGTLLAGHIYQWDSGAYTHAQPNADGGATASGSVTLTIGAVPEQGSLIVWSLLALSICGAVWWKGAGRRSSV